MLTVVWVGIAVYAAIAAVGGGFIVGLAVYRALSIDYKRTVDAAYQRAYNAAKGEFLDEMRTGRDKKRRIDQSELPHNADEAQLSFEEGLSHLYPHDPVMQEALRKQREAKAVIPKD